MGECGTRMDTALPTQIFVHSNMPARRDEADTNQSLRLYDVETGGAKFNGPSWSVPRAVSWKAQASPCSRRKGTARGEQDQKDLRVEALKFLHPKLGRVGAAAVERPCNLRLDKNALTS